MNRRIRAGVVALGGGGLVALASCADAPSRTEIDSPVITFVEETGGELVAVDGLPQTVLAGLRLSEIHADSWRGALGVFSGPVPSPEDLIPPMLGTYEVEGSRLVFRGRFPFVRGLQHWVRLDLEVLGRLSGRNAGTGVVTHTFTPAATVQGPMTRVTAVYPTTGTVPMNLLKLYIHLSAPMRFGEAYDHIRLLDENGDLVPDAFLEMPQELWDPDRTRLTLFFDPGRIKREVDPNLQLGLPLQVGHSFRVVIDPAWRDARGQPLAEGFEKALSVTEPDRTVPQVAKWRVDAPSASSVAPVRLDFGEPMDHALAERMLVVLDANGDAVIGSVRVGPEERSWSFTPEQPWRAGRYVIDVHPDIEDLAGNNLAHLFDVARGVDVRVETEDARARIPFVVGS